MKWSTYMVLCAAHCDKEATLDFVAMEDKPYGRYIGKSVNVQNQHAIEKGKMWWPKQVYVMLWSTVLWDESHCKWQSAISKQIMNIFWISKSTSDLFSTALEQLTLKSLLNFQIAAEEWSNVAVNGGVTCLLLHPLLFLLLSPHPPQHTHIFVILSVFNPIGCGGGARGAPPII